MIDYFFGGNILKKVVIIVCIIAMVSLPVIFYASQINIYTFSPLICRVLFQETPEEFCAEKVGNNALGGNYIYSRVDRNGNLFLALTDNQIENWKNALFKNDLFRPIMGAGDIKFFEDYTKCTVKCYKETVLDDIASFSLNAVYAVFMQAIEGKKSEDIKVDYYFVDAVTEEVKYHVVFPDKNLKFTIHPDDFSSYKTDAY